MGTENETPLLLYVWNNEQFYPVRYIPSITFVDGAVDGYYAKYNGVFSASFKVRVPSSRKRFIKFLMANKKSRNEANRIASKIWQNGLSYRNAFANLTLGIPLCPTHYPKSK